MQIKQNSPYHVYNSGYTTFQNHHSSAPHTQPSPTSDRSVHKLAGPWERWSARVTDEIVETLGLGMGFAMLGVDLSGMNNIGWFIIATPGAFVIDAVCYHLTGWTLGKWLFSVKVRKTDGSRLSFTEYLKRNFWVLLAGEALCIPLVGVITRIWQYNRLRAGKPASYDEGKDVIVSEEKSGHGVKFVFGIIIVVALLILQLILEAA